VTAQLPSHSYNPLEPLQRTKSAPPATMIDHVLGRPSSKSRRLQVLAVLSFWSLYLAKGPSHGPPVLQRLSRMLSKRMTPWQAFLATLVYLYATRNFSALAGLASPEPMSNMYDAAYFRATWVLTALDAGFWTAMKIRTKWLRDIAGMVFSLYYLVAAERADEKVRKIRACVTVEHLRVSWNKPTTPYVGFLQRLVRPRLTRWSPRQLRIPRPPNSDYTEPVSAWLYYDGPLADLERHSRIILDIPGGGFVSMNPRCHDDRLLGWASKTGLPIVSIDYGKAPEFPYPHAINECFDAYATIVRTKGRCIGLSGREAPQIALSGDSAGGNLAVATTLMIIETNSPSFRRCPTQATLPVPDGLVCFYPTLDMNIGNWMSDEQMSLIRDREMNKPIVRRKSRQYEELVGTPRRNDDRSDDDNVKAKANGQVNNNNSNGGDDDDDKAPKVNGLTVDESERLSRASTVTSPNATQPEYSRSGPQVLDTSAQSSPTKQQQQQQQQQRQSVSHRAEPMKTRLATSSMISYFNDRILGPEMMRAMILLYIGAHNRPDFSKDYLLSPVLAPEALLAKFPKIFLMTGERDPLVDDTVVFAGRVRRAKEAAGEDATKAVEVTLLPRISHGFMQFPSVFPPAWKYIDRSASWFDQLFSEAEEARNPARPTMSSESSPVDDRPLEMMSMTKMRRGSSLSPSATDRKAAAGAGSGRGKAPKRPGLNKKNSLHHPIMVHLTSVVQPSQGKVQLSSEEDDFSTSVYGTRFAARELPRTQMPEEQMPREVAYRMIRDDLSLDNNPRLKSEEEAEKLMTESMSKNFIDYEEYPHSADLQSRCVNMLGDLFHASSSSSTSSSSALGTATVGSSEAIMLAVLALKKRWAKRRAEANKPFDKPNLIMSSAVQVCWEKATRYFDIEDKFVYCAPDRFVVDPEEMVDMCDENTIGCVLILGTTYTGHYEDVAAVSDLLVRRGVDVPIHVDAASGGFVAPFVMPDLKWDFRCEKVVSINVSGHKYGLVYPGVGWALWRSPEHLPQELVFNIDYLGAQQSSFTLNFSKGASQIVGQYYQLIRLGRRGYRQIMSNLVRNADYLADSLRSLGFVILSETAGAGLPLVAFRLGDVKKGEEEEEERQYDEFALAHQLRARGWVVPAYTMAPKTNKMKLLRVVVREDLSRHLVDALVCDIKLCMETLDKMDHESIQRMGEFIRHHMSSTATASRHHRHHQNNNRHHPKQQAHSSYKDEDHSLQGTTGKTHAAC
ncbi:hypothetical protein CP532_2522, partial [Ophiocordyceps camponoti-leonardi (nom. inval.)]